MFKKKEANTERELKIESSQSFNDELRRRIEMIERRLDSSKKKESKFRTIKKRTGELLEVSSIHGIPNTIRTKNLLILIMWSICTIL